MASRELGEILKFSADHIVIDFNEGAVLLVLPMYFNQYYRVKFFVRHVLEVYKICWHIFVLIPTI